MPHTATRSVGRPTIINEPIVRKLERCLKDGMSIRQACWQSGISHDTFYSRCRADAEFSDRMQAAREYILTVAKANIINGIKKGDTKLSQWWLERRARAEFGITEGNIPEPELVSEPEAEQIDEHTLMDLDKLIAFRERMRKYQTEYIEPERKPGEEPHFSVYQSGRPPRGE